MTEEEDHLITAAIMDDPFQGMEDICKVLVLMALSETIKRRLSELGLHSFIAAQNLCLSDRLKGKAIATAMKKWAAEKWTEVICTDESTFSTC